MNIFSHILFDLGLNEMDCMDDLPDLNDQIGRWERATRETENWMAIWNRDGMCSSANIMMSPTHQVYYITTQFASLGSSL